MKTLFPYLITVLILAALAGPLASSWPDGLDKVAQKLGFDQRETSTHYIAAPLSDYRVPGMGNSPVSGSLAGLAGALICFLVPFSLYWFRRK